MSSLAQIWGRPWALALSKSAHRVDLPETHVIGADHRGSAWIYASPRAPIVVNGGGAGQEVSGFSLPGDLRTLQVLPLPIRHSPPTKIRVGDKISVLHWPTLPERPPLKREPQTEPERAGYALFLRARSVWDRLRDLDSALSDPLNLWQDLRKRWTGLDDTPPQMDVIVRQANHLSRIVDELQRAPRRILRRTHRQIPISRVQEIDRRAMNWLVRQPGETLAERGGDRQKILAVAREENFDTLENRVLRAYCDLAHHVASEYLKRNLRKRGTTRARRVEEFGVRCRRLAQDLASRGVRVAEAGVTPNFVLQENVKYRRVWDAWHELLGQEKLLDDLWRWQARSWEEDCALAVMVALVGIPGATLVASAPIEFLGEQICGSWIQHDNPLGVFHLPEQGRVVEVRYRMNSPARDLADFAAPIWVRVGEVGDVSGFLSNIAIWPMWDAEGSLVKGEADELQQVIGAGRKAGLKAGIVIRPAVDNETSESEIRSDVLALSMGTDKDALWSAVDVLSDFLASNINRGRK